MDNNNSPSVASDRPVPVLVKDDEQPKLATAPTPPPPTGPTFEEVLLTNLKSVNMYLEKICQIGGAPVSMFNAIEAIKVVNFLISEVTVDEEKK